MHNKAKFCKNQVCPSVSVKQSKTTNQHTRRRAYRFEQNWKLSFVWSQQGRKKNKTNSMVSYFVTQHHLSNAVTECHDVMVWCTIVIQGPHHRNRKWRCELMAYDTVFLCVWWYSTHTPKLWCRGHPSICEQCLRFGHNHTCYCLRCLLYCMFTVIFYCHLVLIPFL